VVAIIANRAAALMGLLRGQPWQRVLLTGLSLLFATIPEELPILIAATLAVSAQVRNFAGSIISLIQLGTFSFQGL
jgi:Ca2+-transporting ATPase